MTDQPKRGPIPKLIDGIADSPHSHGEGDSNCAACGHSGDVSYNTDELKRWTKESVVLMAECNQRWVAMFGLAKAPFRWSLEDALLIFEREEQGDEVVADICCVATLHNEKGTFMWSWANETIPAAARERAIEVREFGEARGLVPLTTSVWPGDRAEGLQMASIAGKILAAQGIFTDDTKEATFFFTLHNFRKRPSTADDAPKVTN